MTPLDSLYHELDTVEGMTEDQVCAAYNAESKQDIIDLIREDIDSMFTRPHYYPSNEHICHDDDSERELEQERSDLCRMQGISRYS